MADDYALTHKMSSKSGNPQQKRYHGSGNRENINPEIWTIERDKVSLLKFQACRAGTLPKGLQICEKRADQNFGPILPPGPWWWNLIKIFSLFNTQPNRPRASPASFKHVGQALYPRGFKFGKNGQIKILVQFYLQVRGGGI